MIFITVGTHEQPFNRLLEYMDHLKCNDKSIKDKIIMQTGFSTYEPQYCQWQKMFSYQEMIKNIEDARIVITHGGPSSFIMPLQIGKIPIVVPRQKKFNEHVNDHQVEFCEQLVKRQGNIIAVTDISLLQNIIINYENIINQMNMQVNNNNQAFNERFSELVAKMITS